LHVICEPTTFRSCVQRTNRYATKRPVVQGGRRRQYVLTQLDVTRPVHYRRSDVEEALESIEQRSSCRRRPAGVVVLHTSLALVLAGRHLVPGGRAAGKTAQNEHLSCAKWRRLVGKPRDTNTDGSPLGHRNEMTSRTPGSN